MPDIIHDILAEFRNFDRNADGDPAIASLSYLNFESPVDDIPRDGRLVLVLVEPRLLSPLPGAEDLISVLMRYKGDLRAEGYFSRFISADVYHGERNQDGRTLLAIRRFLREVKLAYGNFAGVVLIGGFPEAPVLRQCIWRFLRDGKPFELGIQPSLIATRAEIVLSDLNGNWHLLYHEEPESLEDLRAKPDAATAATDWPVDGGVFCSNSYTRKFNTYRDFFFVQDSDCDVVSAEPGTLKLLMRRQFRHPELSAADRSLPNPMSRPDIVVSRINARHVAVNPDPEIRGDDGTPPLDAAGLPQPFSSSRSYDTWLGFFKQDPIFERRLLRDYFDRNHRFRTGAFDNLPFRAGSIASPDFDANRWTGYLAAASAQFGPPLVKPKATLLDYVNWFKQPAVLRFIEAHSCLFNSGFCDKYDPNLLEQAVGGRPFKWIRTGNTYSPTLQGQGGNADFFVHRSMWKNGVLSGANLIIHGGCSVNEPANWETNSSSAEYGSSFQNAEGLLFYMNCLAVMSRAKDYWDWPDGFPGGFAAAARANFGDCWKAYFENNATDAELWKQRSLDDPYTTKKAYFWSMIGDWTVRLRYRGGLGILGVDPQIRARHVHADQAWIDGWNFDTNANTIRGVGDFNGDGASEFLVSSTWGIGVLRHDGDRWRQVLVACNGTRFDGWLLNTANDRFGPIADFDGDGRDEVLVTSAWGIAVLALSGDTFHPIFMAANGTRFGSWLLNTANDRFGPVADFDGDGRHEILVTSAWGVGVLALSGDTFRPLVLTANGTRFDGWLLNTANDRFGPVADFDGDGRHEILITSGWGVGVLALSGDTFRPLFMAANGTRFGDWLLNTASDRFGPVADFDGDGRHEILVMSTWGVGVLALSGDTFRPLVLATNGTRFDGWLLNTAHDRFGPVADFDGDKRDEIVVTSAWGIGVLALSGGTFHPLDMAAGGSCLGDWVLERNDCVVDVWRPSSSSARYEMLVQRGSSCAIPNPFPAPLRANRKEPSAEPVLVSFALE